MPKRRAYRPRKGPVRRRARYSRTKKMVTGHGPTLLERISSGVGEAAKVAQAVAPVIAAINTEEKYYDQTAAITAYNPGTNDQLLFITQGIANGTDDNTRIGNSILARKLMLRMAIDFPSTVGAPNVMYLHARAMLVVWKENLQANGPTINKIFEAPANLYSPVNKDYSDQFVVLKDKFFTLTNSSGVACQAGFRSFKWFRKINWHMRFLGTGTSSGTQNHILLILRSSAAGVGNAMSCTYYSRLLYTDN